MGKVELRLKSSRWPARRGEFMKQAWQEAAEWGDAEALRSLLEEG
jgi:hypothetical protein